MVLLISFTLLILKFDIISCACTLSEEYCVRGSIYDWVNGKFTLQGTHEGCNYFSSYDNGIFKYLHWDSQHSLWIISGSLDQTIDTNDIWKSTSRTAYCQQSDLEQCGWAQWWIRDGQNHNNDVAIVCNPCTISPTLHPTSQSQHPSSFPTITTNAPTNINIQTTASENESNKQASDTGNTVIVSPWVELIIVAANILVFGIFFLYFKMNKSDFNIQQQNENIINKTDLLPASLKLDPNGVKKGSAHLRISNKRYTYVPYLTVSRLDTRAVPPTTVTRRKNLRIKWILSFMLVLSIQIILYEVINNVITAQFFFIIIPPFAILYFGEIIFFNDIKTFLNNIISSSALNQKISLFVQSKPSIIWIVEGCHYRRVGSKNKTDRKYRTHLEIIKPMILSNDISDNLDMLNLSELAMQRKWLKLKIYKEYYFENSNIEKDYNDKAEQFRFRNDPDKFQVFYHSLSINGWNGNMPDEVGLGCYFKHLGCNISLEPEFNGYDNAQNKAIYCLIPPKENQNMSNAFYISMFCCFNPCFSEYFERKSLEKTFVIRKKIKLLSEFKVEETMTVFMNGKISKVSIQNESNTIVTTNTRIIEVEMKQKEENKVDIQLLEVKEWFKQNCSFDEDEKYYDLCIQNGFDSIKAIQMMTDLDLKQIGIDKLGHRKQILAAIEASLQQYSDTPPPQYHAT
eukprot:478750_1